MTGEEGMFNQLNELQLPQVPSDYTPLPNIDVNSGESIILKGSLLKPEVDGQ